MGNRQSSRKKKTTTCTQNPLQGICENTESTFDTLEHKTQDGVTNFGYNAPKLELPDPVANPPTPCMAKSYPNEEDQPGNIQRAQTKNDFNTIQWVDLHHKSEHDVLDEAFSEQNENEAVTSDTPLHNETDSSYNAASVPMDNPDENVYDSIPGTRTNMPGACSKTFTNPEYFFRGTVQRISQQTNTSSNADSAYTDVTHSSGHHCDEDYFCLNCMTCSRPHTIEYMIDVYKRTLQRDLRVQDILSDLHCIGDCEREEIENKAKYSRQNAVEKLLNSIKASEHPGKWQMFFEALERSGYNFIVKQLKGETEDDKEKDKTLLSWLGRELVNSIHVEECLDMLLSEGLVNEHDKEDIECEQKNHGPIAAAHKMFSIVPRKSDEWDAKLPGILKKCGLEEVAKLLEFSQEDSKTPDTDQTRLKSVKCSHQKNHHSKKNHYRRINQSGFLSKTNSAWSSGETDETIKELCKQVQNLEVNSQSNLIAVQKLEETHCNDLREIKLQLANQAKMQTERMNGHHISLNEIKKEVADMKEQHKIEFDELKSALFEIKSSVSALTNIICPSPPVCQSIAGLSATDSGFSGGLGSVPEECQDRQMFSECCNLHDLLAEENTQF